MLQEAKQRVRGSGMEARGWLPDHGSLVQSARQENNCCSFPVCLPPSCPDKPSPGVYPVPAGADGCWLHRAPTELPARATRILQRAPCPFQTLGPIQCLPRALDVTTHPNHTGPVCYAGDRTAHTVQASHRTRRGFPLSSPHPSPHQ